METNLLFEETYKASMLCLRINRSHPSVARDCKWALQFILMYTPYFIIGIHCVYNMIFINFKERDILNVCSNGVFMVILVVVSFKYGAMLWYQKDIQNLIRLQQEYLDLSQEFTVEERAIVQKYIEKGQWVSRLWVKSCIVTAIMFPVKSFIDTAYSAYIGDFKLYSFNENSYPLGIDEIKNRLDIYFLIYSTFVYYAFFTLCMYAGFAPLGPIFILNACAQIEIVTKRINQLFDGRGFDKEETPKELKNIVQFLQKTYSFVDRINEVFPVLYEMFLKASSVLSPISLFMLIESLRAGKLSLDYMMFSYMAGLLCFIPCLYSDKLEDKGDELRFAIYSCGWEKFFDKKTRVTLHIMLTRASRPLSIKTVFRTVCLESFSDVCKQAYVIFNMMYAVLE